MKVTFVCTGNTFTPTMLYKENYFIKASVNCGYETLVLATQYTYKDGKKELAECCEADIDGYKLVRLPYKSVLGSEAVTEKIRNAQELNSRLISFAPNFIFYNCPQIYNITQLRIIKNVLLKVTILQSCCVQAICICNRVLYRRRLKRQFAAVHRFYL